MAKRTAEFIVGLIGGIFGILGGLLGMMIGGMSAAFGGGASVVWLGISAIAFSILGIVGSATVRHNSKKGGWMMLIAAVGGTISVSFAYALAGPLLLVAGLLALIRKEGELK